jgi:hypothetical protein
MLFIFWFTGRVYLNLVRLNKERKGVQARLKYDLWRIWVDNENPNQNCTELVAVIAFLESNSLLPFQ